MNASRFERTGRIIGTVVASAAALAVTAALVFTGNRQSHEDAEKRLGTPMELVQESGNIAVAKAMETASMVYMAHRGFYLDTIDQMETPTPYPVLRVHGKALGRLLPTGAFPIPPYTSKATRAKIARDGRLLSNREANAYRVPDPSRPYSYIEDFAVVRAAQTKPGKGATEGDNYAATEAEFARYRRLTDDLTEGARESVGPLQEQLRGLIRVYDDDVKKLNTDIKSEERTLEPDFDRINKAAKLIQNENDAVATAAIPALKPIRNK